MATVSATDNSFSSGVAGIGVDTNNSLLPLNAVFDNVSALAVPDPTSLVLAMLGSLGVVSYRRQRTS